MEKLIKILNLNKKSLINILAGLFLAGICLYFVFSKIQLGQIIKAFDSANLLYLVLAIVVSILSHVIRALRFVLLLKPLCNRSISLFNCFATIMFGYTINLAIPRAGELARTYYLANLEDLPISLILPTVIIDRLLDIMMLALLACLSLYFLPAHIAQNLPWLKNTALMLSCMAGAGFILLPVLPKVLEKISKTIKISQIEHILKQIEQGVQCLNSPKYYPQILSYSFFMWFMYFLNYLCVFKSLHLFNLISLNIMFTTFLVGSLSVLIPTPGCVGSFHLMVSETLNHISTISIDNAIIFATVLHFTCFIISTILPAGFCMLILAYKKFKRKI